MESIQQSSEFVKNLSINILNMKAQKDLFIIGLGIFLIGLFLAHGLSKQSKTPKIEPLTVDKTMWNLVDESALEYRFIRR